MNSSFKTNQVAYSRVKNLIFTIFSSLAHPHKHMNAEEVKNKKKKKQRDDYHQMCNNLSCFFWTQRTENLYIF